MVKGATENMIDGTRIESGVEVSDGSASQGRGTTTATAI
jgi:hypothetical protein